MKRWVLGFGLGLLPFLATAETVYVSERLSVPVYGAPAEGPAVRTVEGGTALEVEERKERFARVRDRVGEVWIDVRYLSNELPVRPALARANEELGRVRRDLADAQARLKKAEADLAAQVARNAALARQVSAAAASAAAPPLPAAAVETAPAEKPAEKAMSGAENNASGAAAEAGLSLVATAVWLGVAFAMLVLGLFTGRWWLRESIKRRSGGMYLRV